jgi:hypothetical protein
MDAVSVAVAANLAAFLTNVVFTVLSLRRLQKYQRKWEDANEAEYKALVLAKEYAEALAESRALDGDKAPEPRCGWRCETGCVCIKPAGHDGGHVHYWAPGRAEEG